MYLRLNTYLLLKDDTDNKYNGGNIEMLLLSIRCQCCYFIGLMELMVMRCC